MAFIQEVIMKFINYKLFLLVLIFGFFKPIFSYDQKPIDAKESVDKEINIKWSKGLRFTTEDKSFDVRIGGKIQVDTDWFWDDSSVEPAVGEIHDGAEIRRARLYVSGTIYENLIFKLEYDFATGSALLRDGYIGIKNIPYVGTVRAGHILEPYGLENLTRGYKAEMIEFSLPVDVFAPVWNMGIVFSNPEFNKRMTWATSIFRDSNDYGFAQDDDFAWTSRLTGLPYYKDKGRKYVHLGATYSLRWSQDAFTYDSRPEAHMAPYFVNTGNLSASSIDLFNYEFAFIYKKFSLQSEYTNSFVHLKNRLGHAYFSGFYAQSTFFLTKDYRPYNQDKAIFAFVNPRRNFAFKAKGFGAVELLVRYSYADLDDTSHGVTGGKLWDLTGGVNWYLSSNMRMMANYIYSRLHDQGSANIFLTRFQVNY